MRVKAALIAAFVLAGAHLALAEPLRTGARACGIDPEESPRATPCAAQAPTPQTLKGAVILAPEPAILGDVLGARGPDPHARELREIALAAAIGNQEKIEIAARQLRKFGVTRAEVREAIDQAQTHIGSIRAASRRFAVVEQDLPEAGPGWEGSQ